MRKNFYQLLTERKFDIQKEYSALWSLFCVEHCWHSTFTMYEWVEKVYFRELPFRGSFTSLRDMMTELGITEHTRVSLDKLFLFCELLYAIFSVHDVKCNADLTKQVRTIVQNIAYILDHTNHELADDSNGNKIIVEKNKTATLAAQLVDDDVIAFELIEYNHFAIKGDLESKKKLLFSIGAYIEPILKSKVLQQKGYKQLESDAGFLLNNFHIRHNNKVGAKAQEYITTVTDAELEEWYDKAYEVALSVIIINDYLSIGKDIADIKSQYAWKA